MTKLLFIEPKNKSGMSFRDLPPQYRGLGRKAVIALAEAVAPHPDNWWRGSHTCICGARSDSIPWASQGKEIHTLLVHYLTCHADEIPLDELAKLQTIRDDGSPDEELILAAVRTLVRHYSASVVLEHFTDPEDEVGHVIFIRVKLKGKTNVDVMRQIESRIYEIMEALEPAECFCVDVRQSSC